MLGFPQVAVIYPLGSMPSTATRGVSRWPTPTISGQRTRSTTRIRTAPIPGPKPSRIATLCRLPSRTPFDPVITMNRNHKLSGLAALSIALTLAYAAAHAAVSAEEAAALKAALTPMGAEKAANKDGTIPAWNGGLTTVTPGFIKGGRRPDPFASDKAVYSVDAKNVQEHAARLPDGVKQLMQRYPNSFRVDVYPTRRTAAAPQYVYDNTFRNATRAKMVETSAGPVPEGAFAGVPFPIPKTGAEVMWNALLRWRGESSTASSMGIPCRPTASRCWFSRPATITRCRITHPMARPKSSAVSIGWSARSTRGPPFAQGKRSPAVNNSMATRPRCGFI